MTDVSPDQSGRTGVRRIGFVTASGLTVTSFMLPQLAALRDAGVTPVVASGGTGWQDVVRDVASAETLTLGMGRRGISTGDAAAVWRLSRWFSTLKPDAVVGSTPKGMLYGMLAARIAGIPRRIAYFRGLVGSSGTGRDRTLALSVERAAARIATEHLVVSNSLLGEARRCGVLSERQGLVLGLGMSRGVDVSNLARQAAEQPVASSGRVGGRFIWIGRCAARKGFDRLALMWPSIRSALPDATLSVVGSIDESDPPAPTSVAWLQTDNSIRAVGWTPLVGSWLGSSDILLFPSNGEGFPNAPMEAAALAVPTVGFDVTGVRDAIVPDQTGILVRPDNREGFVEGAIRLARDGVLRTAMGDAASRRVRTFFDQDSITARHVRFFLGIGGTHQ